MQNGGQKKATGSRKESKTVSKVNVPNTHANANSAIEKAQLLASLQQDLMAELSGSEEGEVSEVSPRKIMDIEDMMYFNYISFYHSYRRKYGMQTKRSRAPSPICCTNECVAGLCGNNESWSAWRPFIHSIAFEKNEKMCLQFCMPQSRILRENCLNSKITFRKTIFNFD